MHSLIITRCAAIACLAPDNFILIGRTSFASYIQLGLQMPLLNMDFHVRVVVISNTKKPANCRLF